MPDTAIVHSVAVAPLPRSPCRSMRSKLCGEETISPSINGAHAPRNIIFARLVASTPITAAAQTPMNTASISERWKASTLRGLSHLAGTMASTTRLTQTNPPRAIGLMPALLTLAQRAYFRPNRAETLSEFYCLSHAFFARTGQHMMCRRQILRGNPE